MHDTSPLTIDLRELKHDKGAYGLVVFVGDKAIKIFNANHTREHATKVHNDEVKAYSITQETLSLIELTPSFYGSVAIKKIINQHGYDITNEFYIDLTYSMSHEIGPFMKTSSPILPSSEVSRVFELFKSAGIMHIKDCSVAVDDNGMIRKVIDFAIEEHELCH